MDRQQLILEKIFSLLQGKFDEHTPVSDELDEIDAIITGLNMLGEHIASTMVSAEAYKHEKEVAIKACDAKSQFLSNISHELRTPLHGILSFAEIGLNKTQDGDEKLNRYFDTIHQSGQRLKRLVDDLLDLNKLVSHKMLIEIEPANLVDIINSCIKENLALLQQNHLRIDLVDEAQLEAVPVDRFRITQVILNLLNNAIKYSPQNSTIVIKLKMVDVNEMGVKQDFLQVSVIDEGEGIHEAELEDIFDEFIQSKHDKNVTGTGLGLAICREIVRYHGGRIWAQNTDNSGASVNFTLPLRSIQIDPC